MASRAQTLEVLSKLPEMHPGVVIVAVHLKYEKEYQPCAASFGEFEPPQKTLHSRRRYGTTSRVHRARNAAA
jgi:hypothetical protein